MKHAVAFVAFLWVAALTTSALATTSDPRLDAVASRIAQRPVTVECYAEGEHIDADGDPSPDDEDSWGYVYLFDNQEHMNPEVCTGALAILNHDSSVPLWEQAIGALVLTHESYHLRLNLSDRGSEKATECRAIRHVRYVVQFMGGSPELAKQIMPWALAFHWRLLARIQEYYDANCKTPELWAP